MVKNASDIDYTNKEEVAKLLLNRTYMTAVDLAAALGVTKMTAHTLLKKMARRHEFATRPMRRGKRGPAALGYKIFDFTVKDAVDSGA